MRRTLVVLLMLVACGGGSAEEVETTCLDPVAGGPTITIDDFSFGESITVKVGDVVTVTNQDTPTHTLTAADGSFDTGRLASGQSCGIKLEVAGTHNFFCKIHESTMGGRITVEA